MKNVKTQNTTNNNNAIHRLDANLINALKKQGVNVDDLGIVEKGTRIKTDSKLIEMEKQNPTMYKAYMNIKGIHNEILQERFDHNGTEYKITVTIKKA